MALQVPGLGAPPRRRLIRLPSSNVPAPPRPPTPPRTVPAPTPGSGSNAFGSNVAGANAPAGVRGVAPPIPGVGASNVGVNAPSGPRGIDTTPPVPGTSTSNGGVVPLVPGTPDYWAALIHADPRWLAANPGFAARRGQAYAQYGFAPDAAGNLQVDTAASPFSAAGLYRQQLGQSSEEAQNAANSRGVLFSGAQVAAQQGAQNTYQQNLFNALKALQGILGGVSSDESNLYNTIYGGLQAKLPPGGKAS